MNKFLLTLVFLMLPAYGVDARSPRTMTCKLTKAQTKEALREMSVVFQGLKKYPKKSECTCMLECDLLSVKFEPVKHVVKASNVEFEIEYSTSVSANSDKRVERLIDPINLVKIAQSIRDHEDLKRFEKQRLFCNLSGESDFGCTVVASGGKAKGSEIHGNIRGEKINIDDIQDVEVDPKTGRSKKQDAHIQVW